MRTQLEQFRQELYERIPSRADALMDLVDALSSNTTARSVVELSLSPCFRQGYGSVYTAIQNFSLADPQEAAWGQREAQQQGMRHRMGPYLPVPEKQPFWLFGLDVTPAPRPFARTLADRMFVHQPNPVKGNRPVTIGHPYSAVAVLPERVRPTDPPWVFPLEMRRVTSQETATEVGAKQVEGLLDDEAMPFHDRLCVVAVDSAYSVVPFLGQVAPRDNLVVVARVRGNRTFSGQPKPPGSAPRSGHPTWYGEAFRLSDEATWGPPDEEVHTIWVTRRGRRLTVTLQAWHDLLMSGTRDHPMHRYPFTLLRCRVTDAAGKQVFQHPLWLLVMGKRRRKVSLLQAWQAYGQRFDLEHFFRFGKQRLLLTAYQTPQVQHEEHWWQIVCLAYVQLWLARSLPQALPRPWERYLPQLQEGVASPSTVQRDFGRIIRQLGSPADAPKPRGYSPGRAKGQRQPRRERLSVVKKGPPRPKKAQQLA